MYIHRVEKYIIIYIGYDRVFKNEFSVLFEKLIVLMIKPKMRRLF
jgi:hypothetical protein